MIDVKKLAEQAGAHHSAVTSAHCFRPRELEAFVALVLEAAAVECDEMAGSKCLVPIEQYRAAFIAEAIRAMKPAKE